MLTQDSAKDVLQDASQVDYLPQVLLKNLSKNLVQHLNVI